MPQAGCCHKSPRRPCFLLFMRGYSGPASHPRPSQTPYSPGHGLEAPDSAQGIKPGISPFAREGTASHTRCHHHPSPRVPDPKVARASPIISGVGAPWPYTSSYEGSVTLGWVRAACIFEEQPHGQGLSDLTQATTHLLGPCLSPAPRESSAGSRGALWG